MNMEAVNELLANPWLRIWLIGILPSVVIMRAIDYGLDAAAKDEMDPIRWGMALTWPLTLVLAFFMYLGPIIIRAPNWIVDRSAMILAWLVGRLVKGIRE